MVSNSVLKKNKLALTFVSETERFQNMYRLVSYFRISSRKSVDITIQQMIKFDVLSASFIFLLTLFYSFKARYKKEIYSFLIGQNLPGIANSSQKTFKETSKYVFPFQDPLFLGKSQFYFNTNLIEHDLINFQQNPTIKLKRKQASLNKNLIFNGKTISNFYHVNYSNRFEKSDQFVPSLYDQTKSFNRNKIKTTLYNRNLSSPYDLAFQSFAAKNFALSTIKKLEKEGTYFKFSELPLSCDFYFGIFQKKDVTTKLDGIRQNIFKFPQKRNSGAFDGAYGTMDYVIPTGHVLQNQIGNKSQLFLTQAKDRNWDEIYKQNKIITKSLFQKNQKHWFCLDQNKSLQTQWFSLYKNNLSKKSCNNLGSQENREKFKTQPILLEQLPSIFYNVNNLSESQAKFLQSKNQVSRSETLPSYVTSEHNLVNSNKFAQQNVSNTKIDLSKKEPGFHFAGKEKTAFTSVNWWHLIFNGDFSLNSNFIIENINFPFSQSIKSSVFAKQKEKPSLAKRKGKFSYKNPKLDQKWKKKNYHHCLQLDEFPSKLGSIKPSRTLTNQFSTKTKNEILDVSQKKNKSFVIKQKFILRGSKSLLNFSELGFAEQKGLNLQNNSTTSANSRVSNGSPVKDLDSKSRLLKNEIKAIFSSFKNNSDLLKKEKKTFNLLSNRLLTSLDKILLDNSLDTLFEFLPQKNYSTNHKVLQSIDKKDKFLSYKNSVGHDTKETSFLTQENTDLTNFTAKFKNKEKENLKFKHTKKFSELLQNFWSKKEEISHKEDFIEKTKNNWFTFFIKYLNTQPRLMSGYQFPDLNTKEIDKLIKYSDSKKGLINKVHFVREISFFINNFRKNTVFSFQNSTWSIFSQISEKEICQQHPIDVYLPNNYIQKLPRGKYTSLQKNLFFDKKIGAKEIIGPNAKTHFGKEELQLPQAINLIGLNKPSLLQTMLPKEDCGSATIDFDRGGLCSKPLKFVSKSLRLENSTEKQSFFVYQVPALLKIPSIWNPKLQKLQIAKTVNKPKFIGPSIDFSKNTLSSTNFLTDRKQHFFAIGNQIEKEEENSFIQRPLSGSLFGLSYNQEKPLVNKTQTNRNLQSQFLFKVKLQNKGEQGKNFDLIKKDFSILPLLSKVTGKEKDYSANQLSFAPIMPSLHTESDFVFSEKNSEKNLKQINKTSKTLLVSSKTYKIYPKSFKPITGINSYSFFDISAFHSLKTASLPVKKDAPLSKYSSDYETFTDLTQNDHKFDQLPLTKKIVENSKLNVKRKQLSDKCDKQINSLQLVLPFLEPDPFLGTNSFGPAWTKWLSSRYKKPAISYRFQKKVFYLPSNKKTDFFLQQKNRYQQNKWGEVEQQENINKKEERNEDSLNSFSEQVYLPLTIKRSIHFPNRSKILSSKNSKFSFFTTKPLSLQGPNNESKLLVSNLEKINLTAYKHSNTLNSSREAWRILPQKKLSFVSKDICQKQNTADSFFWRNIKENNICLLGGKGGSVTQIPPLSYFLSDTVQKGQTSLFYLKRPDTNCDRLDWQFYQWGVSPNCPQDQRYPFFHENYTYSPPSQSILNQEFLNSLFKNKIRKRNTIYKYSRHFPTLKFRYVKSKSLKDQLHKISTPSLFPQKRNSLSTWKENNSANFSPLQEVSNSKFLQNKNQVLRSETSETANTFRKTYNLSHLQKKESLFNLLFPKKKRTHVCWEPITVKSWMVITQYCYAFFLVQSTLYVYEKHMKKVLLSFAPLLSGRGILSGMPSFGEKLQDFLGGSTIDKNVLLFKKVPKRFQDIVAIDNKLPQLSEIVWFLRNFGRTANLSQIQGVLFVGPPGTGKTLLVQAIAGEAEVPVLVLSGSSFADGKKDKKGGQLLKRVFQRAQTLAPSILFIDEIDTLGESRSHFAQDDRDQKNESSRIIESISHTERKIQDKTFSSRNKENQSVKQVGLLTQFLVEMDGLARQQKNSYFFNNKTTFGKPGGILVIGSTNRPKVLDPALTRPGRFDQVFYLSNPGKQKRIEILKVYTKNIGVSPSLPWDYLGDRTLGFSAADLSAIVNKSTIQAILSNTIHTIQSIENGIESLPKLSQNQNKSLVSEEKDILTSFLSLKSQRHGYENTIFCKSISNSLLICVKQLDLQNKYKSFNFWTDQSKNYQKPISKFLQRETIPPKFVNLEKFKEPLQQSFNDLSLQEKKKHTEFEDSLGFSTENLAFAEQKTGIGFTFLGRLPFYQAGKVMVQVLFSKDAGPIPLVATLWPKQELSFSNMFKESTHVRQVTNRDQLETRLISGYAGKAAETLLIFGLQFYKNKNTPVTWQSTLGVEEWKLTNSLVHLMISKYCFYSQKIAIQKENFIALSQNSNEILETENFQVLQNIFSKEELKFSQEKHHFELSEGKTDIFNTIGENKSFLNPIIWVSNLCQQYEITKIFGHIEENNWYQVYLPPLVKDEQNKEWVPLDQYYFGRENLIELVWNTYKKKSINWSDIYQLNYDLTYQGLVLYHFNKALSLLDRNRELLDLFANLLISFRTIRRHEILIK
ncbi:MAG: AAA family ATPase [Cyanobacteriota bacterium]|nr:MAG: AAA family ATPase [Cyanobacteriota bacterium]